MRPLGMGFSSKSRDSMLFATAMLELPVATILYPASGESLRLADLLASCGDPQDGGSVTRVFQQRLTALEQAERLEQTPIVGVCGTVNSGKSTVVAGFLSEAGRQRVLVGEMDAEGTHRFVFWLPATWRDNGLGQLVEDMIRSATGTEPEKLAEDPAAAALQYNATRDRAHEFNIPLVAFDTRLDEAGIAFLDCPDTQRSLDETAEEFTAMLRLERLKTIAPMCSAFVVVASMQQKGAEEIGKVFKAITGSASEAPLYFVLNMTRTDEVAKYAQEAVRTLDKWGVTASVRRKYLAPFIHTDDPHAKVFPVITSMDDDRSRLEDLGNELDPAELQRRHRTSCVEHLKALLEDVAERTRRRYQEDRGLVAGAREKVCGFLVQKLIDGFGNPRALEFNEAARQIAESIQRTAPLGIRIAQAPGRWLRELTAKWKRREASDADLEKYAQIKPTDFSGFMLGSRFLRPEVTEATLDGAWKQAFDAVIAHSRKQSLNPHELDEMTRRMWDELPFGKKVALFKNVVYAVVAITIAGALLPFDGGASIVLVSKVNLVLGGAEILGILVGGPLLAALMTGKEARRLVAKFEQECARPQLDALYAALADGFGIPRELDGLLKLMWQGKVCHEFQPSGLATLPDRIGVLGHPLICLDEPAWRAMMESLTPQPS
jgi:hypothetical protein